MQLFPDFICDLAIDGWVWCYYKKATFMNANTFFLSFQIKFT
jgi:hypothetical protein